MTTQRKTEIAVGALFLTATASYLVGSDLIDSAASAPDRLSDLDETALRIGVVLEFVNAGAVVGIGVLLFPVLRKHREGMALGYAATRIIESALLLVSALSALLLVPASQEYLGAQAADGSERWGL